MHHCSGEEKKQYRYIKINYKKEEEGLKVFIDLQSIALRQCIVLFLKISYICVNALTIQQEQVDYHWLGKVPV